MPFLISLLVGLSTLWCVGLNDPGKDPGTYQDYVLNQLNPDCYYNWAIYSENNLKNPKFNPMLWRVNQENISQAVRLAKQFNGRTWLVYNEPEGIDQANVDPVTGATWFDLAYDSIKSVDPTAIVACCGVMIRNEGIEWLNTFVKTAKHKPDAWHIHVYVNENKFSTWEPFLDHWWWWNNANGNNLPTYITETCAMYQTAQEDLLVGILEYHHPLLERVYWFSAYPEPIVKDWYCNLLNNDGDLVGLGSVFQDRERIIPSPTVQPTITPIPEDSETTDLPTAVEPFHSQYLPIMTK